jgi:hypothetical protein
MAYTQPEAEESAPKTGKSGLTSAEEKEILEEAHRRMKRALEADQTDRDRARKELRFVWNVDNCQWDDEAKKVRKSRPMLTENRNPSFVRQATNEVRRSRPQVRVLPVDNQGDPFTAQIYEGLIRNIEANSRADMAYDGGVESASYCGRGYWKVCTEYQGDGFEQDITIEPVPDPFSIVDDPDAVYPDKSDRTFAFEVEKCPKDEYKSKYGYDPKAFEEAASALGDYAANWVDGDDIVIANYWRICTESSQIYRMSDGTVQSDPKDYVAQLKMAHAAQAAVMGAMPQDPMAPMPLQPMVPPFVPPTVTAKRELVNRRVEWYCVDGLHAHSKGDWAGQYIPLVYTTCEQMKIDGKWRTKGMTYDAQDLTKANNYVLSAQIENIALTPKVPWVGPVGSFNTQKSKWNNSNQENYAYLEYDIVDGGVPPQRAEGAKANPELAQVRMGLIDGQRNVVGLMAASLGDQGPEQSFIAIQARQSRGDTAVFHVSDNLQRAVRYGGMVIVDLIPKIYDSKRVVRIINPDGEPVMQAINQAFVDPKTGETKHIDMKAGKFDITVSAGPAFETQRQQNNATLAQLAEKVPSIAQAAPDLLAKALLMGPDGDKIAQRAYRTLDPAITGDAPPPAMKKLQSQLQGLQQQMHEISTQKDFFESELAKQKSLVEKAGIDNQTKQIEMQRKLAELQGELESSRLDVQKKEIELEKAQLAAIRASMPAPTPSAAPLN